MALDVFFFAHGCGCSNGVVWTHNRKILVSELYMDKVNV